jgi:hypothetical protein
LLEIVRRVGEACDQIDGEIMCQAAVGGASAGVAPTV